MTRKKRQSRTLASTFIELVRDLRIKLREIDHKLEHLIRSHQHFYSLHYRECELDD